MHEIESVSSIVYYAGTILVCLIGWGVRLELKVKNLGEDHLEHKLENAQLWAKFESIQKTLNDLLVAIGRLEGKMDNHNN